MASRQRPVNLTAYDGQTYRYAGKWRYVVTYQREQANGTYMPLRRAKATDNHDVARDAAQRAHADLIRQRQAHVIYIHDTARGLMRRCHALLGRGSP